MKHPFAFLIVYKCHSHFANCLADDPPQSSDTRIVWDVCDAWIDVSGVRRGFKGGHRVAVVLTTQQKPPHELKTAYSQTVGAADTAVSAGVSYDPSPNQWMGRVLAYPTTLTGSLPHHRLPYNNARIDYLSIQAPSSSVPLTTSATRQLSYQNQKHLPVQFPSPLQLLGSYLIKIKFILRIKIELFLLMWSSKINQMKKNTAI